MVTLISIGIILAIVLLVAVGVLAIVLDSYNPRNEKMVKTLFGVSALIMALGIISALLYVLFKLLAI